MVGESSQFSGQCSRVNSCLVWIDETSRTLAGHAWNCAMGDQSLIQQCVNSLASTPYWDNVVVSGPRITEESRAKFRLAANVQLHSSDSFRHLVSEVSQQSCCEDNHVAFLHGLFGLELFSLEFLSRLITHHHQTGVGFTVADHLPAPLYAYVFKVNALSLVNSVPKEVAIPDNPGDLFRIVKEAVKIVTPGEKQDWVSLSFLNYFNITPKSVPPYIPWSSPSDAKLLEYVRRIENPPGSVARLSALREILTTRWEDECRKDKVGPRNTGGRKRVLYASNPSAFSGSEQCLISTVRAVANCDWDVHCLVALEGNFAEGLRRSGATVHCPGRDFSAPSVANAVFIDTLFDSIRPSLVHCNAVVGVPLLAVSRIRDIPLAQWVRVANVDGLIEHLICADLITTVSRFVAMRVSEAMVRPHKIHLLYDCVDTELFSPAAVPMRDIRLEYGISGSAFVVLCVARFVPYKRIDVLISAIADVRQALPEVILILMGEKQKSYEWYYSKCVLDLEQRGIRGITRLIDFEADIASFELAADVIVLCSEDEPLGTVVLEGMALGKPVVVSNSGGLPEMVEHGKSGLHCTPGSADSLKRQILALAANRDFGRELGQNARERVVSQFSFRAHAKRLRDLYSDLTEEFR